MVFGCTCEYVDASGTTLLFQNIDIAIGNSSPFSVIFWDKPPPNTAYFVLAKVARPFEACVAESDDKSKKCIAVNMQDNTLTVEVLDGTQQSTTSFVISDAEI